MWKTPATPAFPHAMNRISKPIGGEVYWHRLSCCCFFFALSRRSASHLISHKKHTFFRRNKCSVWNDDVTKVILGRRLLFHSRNSIVFVVTVCAHHISFHFILLRLYLMTLGPEAHKLMCDSRIFANNSVAFIWTNMTWIYVYARVCVHERLNFWHNDRFDN